MAISAALAQSAFAHANFRRFWTMRFANTFAFQMLTVALGWQVYDIARETMSIAEAAFMLGLIGLAQFVPLFGLTLLAGYAADRLDRRWIIRVSVSAECLAALALLAETLRDDPRLIVLFAVAATFGVTRAFTMPAQSALAPNLVPRAILPSAIALNSMAWQTASVLGPALGGYVYLSGPATVYGVCAGLYLVSLSAVARITPVARPPRSSLTPWQMVKEGLHYIRTNRIVLGAITLDLWAVLLGGATAMLPVFARDILMVGPDGLGHLRAAPAIGAVLVATVLAVRPLRRRVGHAMFAGVAVYGVATAAFGLSTSFWASLLLLVLLGAGDMLSVYVRSSLIQLYTPDAMRGRVAAVSTLCISASNELGEFESGLAARIFGAVGSVVLGGLGATAVTGIWAWRYPELRTADRFDTIEPEERHDESRPAGAR